MNQILNFLMNWTPEKIAFKIGDFEIAWYGILMTIGFLCAIAAASLKLKFWYKVSIDPFIYFCFIGIPVSILGARTWSFIIGDASVTTNFFADFWNFRQGGLAIQGGVVCCVISACIWFPLILKKPAYQVTTIADDDVQKNFSLKNLNSSKEDKNINATTKNYTTYVRRVSMWVYADAIIPCILIGQIIGRWGNFANQELYGAVVDNPEISMSWLKKCMPLVYEGMIINGQFRQPLFLYESFMNFWIFIFLYVGCEFIKFKKCGDLGILYFFFYGVLRLSMEPFRDQQFMFVTSIITSVLYIVIAIALLILNHLVFSKHRDYKFLWMLWVKTKFYLYLRFKPEIKNNQIAMKNFGYNKPISFYRTKEEMLYYRGE